MTQGISTAQEQLYDNSDCGKQQNANKEQEDSRKGSSINTLSRDERQQLYNMIDAKLKSEGKPWDYVYTVTGKDYEGPAYEAFANMPENKDMVNGLILEITNSRNGSRKGSRPENLGSIASKIALGRNRSIGQESREGGMLDTILEDRDNVAQSMYGKPYSELSEEEKNSATNKQIELKKQQG